MFSVYPPLNFFVKTSFYTFLMTFHFFLIDFKICGYIIMKYRNNLIEIRGVRYESVQRKIYAIHVWKIRNRYIRKMDSRAGTRYYADRRMDI